MQTRRRLPRSALPIALSAAGCLLLGLWLTFGWGGPDVVVVVDSLGFVAFAGYATVCTVLAARAAAGRARVAWSILAVALACWGAGDLTWAFYELVLHRSPFPSPADLFYVLASALVLVAMTRFPRKQSERSRLRMLTDALIVAVALLLLLWVLALEDVYRGAGEGTADIFFALIYPLLDVATIMVAVLLVAGARTGQRSVMWLLFAAVVLTAASDIVFAYLTAIGRYDTGVLIDIGWVLALVLFAAAALLSRHSHSEQQTPDDVPPSASLWVPYAPLLIAGTIGPAAILTGPLQIGVPVLMTLIVVRQSLAAWENRRLLAAAAEQALRDPLTGLANRALFSDRLAHAMTLRARDDRSVAVISLDLDDFKLVNDSLGPAAADTLLIAAGHRIADCIRPGDTVARVGGDEFAVLMEGDSETCRAVAQRVVEAFDQPFVLDGRDLRMRPSAGLALADADAAVSADELLKQADVAMGTAKRFRSRELCTFSPEMAQVPGSDDAPTMASEPEAARLLGELRHAIDQRDLTIVYQPKIDLRTGQLAGVEALLRWPHSDLGTLSPDTFLPLVRQHGLMRPVTDLVIDQALTDTATWTHHNRHIPVAINLFAPLLRDTELPHTLTTALHHHGLTPDLLTVEITEDLVLAEIDTVTTVLHQLRHHGIRVAIDDFGSGYSALAYLRDLPIDEIKLDRHFIANVTTNPKAAAVVQAVINLTHTLDITVVAEGVEDTPTATWLTNHHCDIAQGYHYGKPTTATAITQLATEQAATTVGAQHLP